MSTVDFLSKEGVARIWQAVKDYAISNELLAQPSGVATLDEFGKVLQTQLPDYILGQVLFGGTIDGNGVATLTTLFKNRYNLSVATLDVDNLTAANYEGSYFIATANGVSGIAKTLDIVVGDWVISNGSEWTKIDNTDAVRTVLGLKGDIQAPDLRNAMLGKSGNQGTNLALGDIWMGNGDGTVVTHRTSVFARSILASIAENTMFSKLWADRATNDGNGKNIASTYMPFTGGTFTGDVTHNANMILANSKVIAGKDTSGSNISLLSLNTSNQVVIGYGAHNKYDTLLYGNKITAYGDFYGLKGVSAKGIADFGVGGSSGGNGGAHYDLLIDQKNDRVTLQLKGDDGDIDTKDMLAFSTSRAGIVPNAPSAKSVLFGGGWKTLEASDIPSLDWSKIATGKPTTLGGYGITDAYTKSQIQNGVFPNMRVGLADDLGDIEETLDEEYTFQPTANPNEIRDGYAQIESLKGNSLVWNQLVADNFISRTLNSQGSHAFNAVKYVETHYYIIIKTQAFDSGNVFVQTDGVIGMSHIAGKTMAEIFRCDQSLTSNPYIYNASDNPVDINCSIMIHDLTQMFGEGNEPTTVEEFERRCPKGMLMDYNEGEVIHFNGDIKSVGFNQWDEEWEVGGINTSNGKNNAETDKIRGKNFIRVTPSSEYYCKSPIASRIFFYDSNKNYISNDYLSANSSFTILDNAYYIRFRIASDYGTTYNHDICINLSDPDKNGTYEPYTEFRRDLPTELFEGGMKSAGTAYDEIYWDKAKRANVKVQRFGGVDLGTLNWRFEGSPYNVWNAIIEDAVKSNSRNIICHKYTTQKTTTDKTIELVAGFYTANKTSVLIADSSYTDAESFKAAMSGVMLYYELAEPIVEEIDIPYMDYQVSNSGTEEIVSDVPTTPVKARVTYNFDTVGTVRQNRFDISALKIDLKSNYQPLATAINTSNIGSQSVARAIADGNGNVIKDTYLSKVSGGTINESVTVNGSFKANVVYQNGFRMVDYLPNPSEALSLNDATNQYGITSRSWVYAQSNLVSGQPLGDGASSAATVWDLGGNYPIQIYHFYNSTTDIKWRSVKSNVGDWHSFLHSGNTKLTLDAAYNWEDKNSQTNKQVYGFTLNVNGTEIGMSAITKEELEAILV